MFSLIPNLFNYATLYAVKKSGGSTLKLSFMILVVYLSIFTCIEMLIQILFFGGVFQHALDHYTFNIFLVWSLYAEYLRIKYFSNK